MDDNIIYHGSIRCQATVKTTKQPCTNGAYYAINDNGKRHYRCGVHSCENKRQKLPIDPYKQERKLKLYQERQVLVEMEAKKNHPHHGHIIVSKLKRQKAPEHHDTYLKVFPNFKHSKRKDGLGCSTLSPKFLGPINHGMPELPIAKNLENFHQGAKFWKFELDTENRITPKALKKRIEMYKDTVPHRHKYPDRSLGNSPAFSLYYDKDGNERRYSYLECRYFYCHWYERLAPQQEEFNKLCGLRDQGYNLQILGYDGYPVTMDLYSHYLDTTKPFGHELVLYSLLTVDNPHDYPWNRFYREHKHIYENVI